MSYAQLEAGRFYYEDSGGEGPAVVFSHGLMMDHEMFGPQVEALAGEFRCITWDERGHGDTKVEGSWTYWDSAADVFALLDHLGIDKAFLVGMSQGGFLSLRAALTDPDRVLGLFLIDTQAGPEDRDKTATYQAMVDAWVQEPQRYLAEASAAVILGPGTDEEYWIQKWLKEPNDWPVEPFKTLIGREDIHDRLGEIQCPAIVVHGTNDMAIPMDLAYRLCKGLPNCEGVVEVEGGTHAANLSHPEIVNEALINFLRAHSS